MFLGPAWCSVFAAEGCPKPQSQAETHFVPLNDARSPIILNLQSATVGDVLTKLFAGRAGMTYSLSPDLAKVVLPPITIKDVPLQTALRAVLDCADLTFTESNGHYSITRRNTSQHLPTSEIRASQPAPTLGYSLFNKTRYEVASVLGKPEKIEYTHTPGHELWRYADKTVEFANCRVLRTTAPCLRVATGSKSGTTQYAPPPQRNTGSEWVSGLRDYLRLSAFSSPPAYRYGLVSYEYVSYSSIVSYSISPSISVSTPVMFNSHTGAPILWK
jgi:hypothetical protein